MKRITQKEQVVKHLRRRSLSSWEAYDLYGITQLGTRIHELRAVGYPIITDPSEDGGYAHYILRNPSEGERLYG